jgi:hypothetical protein
LETIKFSIASGKVILGIKDEYPIKIYQQRPNLTKTVLTIKEKILPLKAMTE